MDVSTERPYSTAATLAPLPRWQVMIRKRSMSVPRCLAAAPATYWWDGPWNPYRRIPCFSVRSRGSAYRFARAGRVA